MKTGSFTNTICDGSRYFEVNTDEVDWSTAKASCEERGGKLAKLDTETSNTYVANYIKYNNLDDEVKGGFWIGLNDIDNEGTFGWLDGSGLEAGVYNNWGGGEPNNKSDRQHCVHLWKKSEFQWYDAYCTSNKGYICEYKLPMKTGSCNSNCVIGTIANFLGTSPTI
ncbi:salivary C-type lectin 2-like [Saccoglossus kowalevskii]